MQHFASSSILSNSGMSCVQRSQVWEQGGERLARPLYSHLSYTSLCRRPPVTASSCCSLPEAGCGTFRSHPGLLHKTQHSLYNSRVLATLRAASRVTSFIFGTQWGIPPTIQAPMEWIHAGIQNSSLRWQRTEVFFIKLKQINITTVTATSGQMCTFTINQFVIIYEQDFSLIN